MHDSRRLGVCICGQVDHLDRHCATDIPTKSSDVTGHRPEGMVRHDGQPTDRVAGAHRLGERSGKSEQVRRGYPSPPWDDAETVGEALEQAVEDETPGVDRVDADRGGHPHERIRWENAGMHTRVCIVEVGPRDGLQAEGRVLSPPTRLDLIARCAAAGAARIEVCSFAHPKLLPQMAGAEEIVAAIDPDRRWSAIGLVLNERGMERALATSLDEVNLVGYASDGYAGKNTAASAKDRNAEARRMIPAAKAAGKRVSVTIAVSFGDPVEGEVPVSRLAGIAAEFAEAGADEIALGDTAGVGTPKDVVERLDAVRDAANGVAIRLHFHNTHNTGYANVIAALHAGVDALDTSVGGFGGSPFSPGAGGNVATEDVVWMLERMGVQTGMDAAALAATGTWLAGELGHAQAQGMLDRAGPWP